MDVVRCPFCSFDSTRVVDSRLADPGDTIRRRRECAQCGNRFTTHERAEEVPVAGFVALANAIAAARSS